MNAMLRTIAIVLLLLGIAINANAQTHIPLNNGWTLQRVDDTLTVAATIPGTVHTDLWHAGRIPNPLAGCNEAQLQALHAGVLLHGETEPCRAQDLQVRGERLLAMSIEQGKYHQVKRMVAAAGNRVQALHREQFGRLTLDDLAPGEWRYLDEAQKQQAQTLD